MESRSVSAQLGLESLPGRVDKLASGMIYGVACDQQALRLPLVAGALLASLAGGKRCALLSQADPGMFLRKARLAGLALEPHVGTGLLTIFHLDGEAAKHLFRTGIEGFLAELEQNFPGEGAFLVLDQADPLFMLSDPRASADAVRRHMDWAAAHDHTVLAMFAPAAAAPRDYFTLKQVAENFGGFAIARATEGGALLEVRHWFGAEGASPRESFILRCNASGTLGIHPGAYPDEELPPVDSVIFVREAMAGETPLWRSGQEVDSIADAVDAARRSEAATLLLPFQKQSDYELLCRAIVTVRAMARPSLRVVVRERRLRLRASQTLALMRLGVSSIVPADLSDSAAKRMVDTLHGTRFARPYEMDAQQVDAETSALTRRAVTSAGSFCDAVECLLAAADDFEIESCLVRLDFAAAEASAVVKIARRLGRDLVAFAHGDSAWLYVFGCPKSKVPTVLERLFKAPPGAMRASCATEHDPNRILAQLSQLREDCPAPR
jgi:cellulose biosynthesis protein BcsE